MSLAFPPLIRAGARFERAKPRHARRPNPQITRPGVASRGAKVRFAPDSPLEVLTVGIVPCRLRGPCYASLPKTKFAADSALEKSGFEPVVPATWPTRSRPSLSPGSHSHSCLRDQLVHRGGTTVRIRFPPVASQSLLSPRVKGKSGEDCDCRPHRAVGWARSCPDPARRHADPHPRHGR
jgi:hypothetical protein